MIKGVSYSCELASSQRWEILGGMIFVPSNFFPPLETETDDDLSDHSDIVCKNANNFASSVIADLKSSPSAILIGQPPFAKCSQ
jgi:hypothetical protein